MSYINHLPDMEKNFVHCKKCGRKYLQYVTEQVPGFRMKDYDTCPYCDNVNGFSMSEEYDNRKEEE